MVEGYSGEPYARIDGDGVVSVNTDSQAYYINEERDGQVEMPPGADSKGEPRWKEISRTGRFEWHDHRMHWMAEGDPEVVKDKDVRTKVFDWKVPLRGRRSPRRDRRHAVLDARAVPPGSRSARSSRSPRSRSRCAWW